MPIGVPGTGPHPHHEKPSQCKFFGGQGICTKVRCEFLHHLPGGSNVLIKYDQSFKDVNLTKDELTNSQSIVAQAVSVKGGKEIILATTDGKFFNYQKDLGQLQGPISLSGQQTALKTFSQLEDVYFVAFTQQAGFGAPLNYGF